VRQTTPIMMRAGSFTGSSHSRAMGKRWTSRGSEQPTWASLAVIQQGLHSVWDTMTQEQWHIRQGRPHTASVLAHRRFTGTWMRIPVFKWDLILILPSVHGYQRERIPRGPIQMNGM